MEIEKTAIEGVLILKPKVFRDDRGFFTELFNAKALEPVIKRPVLQINWSHSRTGVIRGLHFQSEHPQGKLVWVVHGEIYDVIVDIRKDSPTFGKHVGIYIENIEKMVWIPPGLAHGMCAMEDDTDFFYAITDNYWCKDCEQTILCNDPDLNIDWPIPGLSPKDSQGKTLNFLMKEARP